MAILAQAVQFELKWQTREQCSKFVLWWMSSLAAGSDGWEVIELSPWVSDRWVHFVKRLFCVRHLQQWFYVCGEALKLYRSELRDKVSRQLGPGR